MRATVKVVFEGDLIPDDINKRYLEYINNFESNDVSKEILSEDEAKKRVQEVTGLDEEKIYYIDYVNEPQRGISDENIAGYTVEVREVSNGGGTTIEGGGFFFVVSSNGKVYKLNIVGGGIYELIAN